MWTTITFKRNIEVIYTIDKLSALWGGYVEWIQFDIHLSKYINRSSWIMKIMKLKNNMEHTLVI